MTVPAGIRWKRPYRFERRLCLGRWHWERWLSAHEVSHEISVWTYLEPQDLWIGLFWEHNEYERWCFYLCLLPMWVLRIKFRRSHGGRFG